MSLNVHYYFNEKPQSISVIFSYYKFNLFCLVQSLVNAVFSAPEVMYC